MRQNFYYIKSHLIVSIFKTAILKNLLLASVLSYQNLIFTLQKIVFTAFLELYLNSFHTNVIEIATSVNQCVSVCVWINARACIKDTCPSQVTDNPSLAQIHIHTSLHNVTDTPSVNQTITSHTNLHTNDCLHMVRL